MSTKRRFRGIRRFVIVNTQRRRKSAPSKAPNSSRNCLIDYRPVHTRGYRVQRVFCSAHLQLLAKVLNEVTRHGQRSNAHQISNKRGRS